MQHRVVNNARRAAACALFTSVRCYHLPGWKTSNSTRDQRTREKREEDRKARQIEKLPKPEALHDYQYPYEKTVLADQLFQTPVFENELDTPELFHCTPPANFFLYWNHSSFDRTNYPAVPKVDHRLLAPDDSNKDWAAHRAVASKYLTKHGITPCFVPHVSHAVNLSVVFNGTFDRRLRRDSDDPSLPAPPRPRVESLEPRNFWFTAHCGNFIELFELQDAPTVFLQAPQGDSNETLYTLMIASPDYPYATAPNISSAGFFLNYVVSNLKPGGTSAAVGDVVVPYVHPLPTEDGGTVRVMCMLFKQKTRVEGIRSLDPDELRSAFPHSSRSQYRLHQYLANPSLGDGVSGYFKLPAVEHSLDGQHPSAVTFFRTSWDIQVQEYYEAAGILEPAYQTDEELEAILQYNATPSAKLRVNARHTPEGAKNPGTDTNFWHQFEPTRPGDGSMSKLWSRRTQLGANGKLIVTPTQKLP
jgi:hypothetical protein